MKYFSFVFYMTKIFIDKRLYVDKSPIQGAEWGVFTDSFLPKGRVCRPSSGACDEVEVCDGDAACCPSDARKAGTVCRPAVNACDIAEVCDGVSENCPTDQLIYPCYNA